MILPKLTLENQFLTECMWLFMECGCPWRCVIRIELPTAGWEEWLDIQVIVLRPLRPLPVPSYLRSRLCGGDLLEGVPAEQRKAAAWLPATEDRSNFYFVCKEQIPKKGVDSAPCPVCARCNSFRAGQGRICEAPG